MNNINSVQLYYKIKNKDSDLYKRANEFLSMEKKIARNTEENY